MQKIAFQPIQNWFTSSLILVSLFLCSCTNSHNEVDIQESSLEFFGKAQSFNDGTVRSFISLDQDQLLTQIGIRISADAIEKLPQMRFGEHLSLIELPQAVNIPPYDHIALTVYKNPDADGKENFHLGVQFYMLMLAERLLISDLHRDGYQVLPNLQFLPANYMPTNLARESEGTLLVNREQASEDDPIGNQIFVYGSFEGEITFMGPVITKLKLSQKDRWNQSLSSAYKVQKDGYYPNLLSFRFDEVSQEYVITLDHLRWRKA